MSIIRVEVHGSNCTVRAYRALCITSLSLVQSQHWWQGKVGGGYTDPFPVPSWGSNWKIWVALLFVLVECGRLRFFFFFFFSLEFPEWRCSVDLGVNQVMGAGLDFVCSGTFCLPLFAFCPTWHYPAYTQSLLGHWSSLWGFCDLVRSRQAMGLWPRENKHDISSVNSFFFLIIFFTHFNTKWIGQWLFVSLVINFVACN